MHEYRLTRKASTTKRTSGPGYRRAERNSDRLHGNDWEIMVIRPRLPLGRTALEKTWREIRMRIDTEQLIEPRLEVRLERGDCDVPRFRGIEPIPRCSAAEHAAGRRESEAQRRDERLETLDETD